MNELTPYLSALLGGVYIGLAVCYGHKQYLEMFIPVPNENAKQAK